MINIYNINNKERERERERTVPCVSKSRLSYQTQPINQSKLERIEKHYSLLANLLEIGGSMGL